MSHTITQENLDTFAAGNATLYINDVEAVVGDVITSSPPWDEMKAVAYDGWEFTSNSFTGFSSVALMNGGNNRVNFTVQTPPSTATRALPVDPDSTFIVGTESAADATINEVDMVYLAEHNTTMFNNGEEFYAGMLIWDGDEITAIVDEGYQFITVQYFQGFPVNFTLSQPPTEASTVYSWQIEKLVYNIVTEQVEAEASGNNNIYIVDRKIMQTVNYERFAKTVTGDSVIDFGRFILGLIEIPTEVPEEYLLDEDFIQLGEVVLTAKATQLSTDVLNIDMGLISVPETYGDLRDFQNTVCNLHLPYASSITVEPVYIIGQDLRVEYLVDVYNGKVTINLYSTIVGDECFYTHNSDLGISIPYAAFAETSTYLGNSNIKLGGDNKLTGAYVEVLRNESPLTNKFFSAPIVDEDEIINHTGFIKVEEIDLKINGSYSEKQKVIEALNEGVIINE